MAKCIQTLQPNYQLGGFYDVQSLPAPVDVAREVGDPVSGKLYHTSEDVFLRWLDILSPAEVLVSLGA
jgi:hypothetical protein